DDDSGGRLADRRGGGGPPPPRAPRRRADRPPAGRPGRSYRARAPRVPRDQSLGDRRHGRGAYHLQRGRRDGPGQHGGGPDDPRRGDRVGPRREESPSPRRRPGDHGRTDDGPRGEGEGDPDPPPYRRRPVADRRRGGLISRGSAPSCSTSTERCSIPATRGSARSTQALPRSAAKGAGARSIGVTWGYGTRDSLEAAGVDHLIETPEALPPLLRALTPSKAA